MTELSETTGLKPFIEINPYRETLNKATQLMSAMGAKETKTDSSMDVKEAVALIDDADAKIKEAEKSLEALNKEKTQLQALVDQIVPFNNLGYDVHKLLAFKSVKYRFGRIPVDYVESLCSTRTIMSIRSFTNAKRIRIMYGALYFSPKNEIAKIDAVYKALHFERFRLPDEYEGTPEEALALLTKHIW